MSLRLTRDLFNSAQVVQGSGQIKSTIAITVNADGSVSDGQGGVLDVLNYGNRGDHCVTKLEFTLPEALQEGYECFFIADLTEGLYVQHCSIEELKAIAWITTDISFSETSLVNTLFACVESEALQTGNVDGEIEIFVTDEFSGQVKANFLRSGWHTGTVDEDYIMTGDETVVDNNIPKTPNPTSYTPMTWVNGETELNAANMNNIMLGIEEAKETLDNVMTSDGDDWNITGGKTFKGQVYFDENSTARIYTTPSNDADIVSKGYVDNKEVASKVICDQASIIFPQYILPLRVKGRNIGTYYFDYVNGKLLGSTGEADVDLTITNSQISAPCDSEGPVTDIEYMYFEGTPKLANTYKLYFPSNGTKLYKHEFTLDNLQGFDAFVSAFGSNLTIISTRASKYFDGNQSTVELFNRIRSSALSIFGDRANFLITIAKSPKDIYVNGLDGDDGYQIKFVGENDMVDATPNLETVTEL